MTATYDTAVQRLRQETPSENRWFHDSYWPINSPRVRAMTRAVEQQCPRGSHVLDIGCGIGQVSCIVRDLGYEVTGIDGWDLPERDALFARYGVQFQKANLNEIHGLAHLPSQSADAILFGEVFEHLLNAPSLTLAEFHRILKPGGVLVLTTPNPSTLMNAIRVLRDDYVLWGTDEFLRMPKVNEGRLTDYGEIHYREYPARVVRREMERVGFREVVTEWVPTGYGDQPFVKQLAKRLLAVTGLDRTRLFAPGYVLTGRA